MGLGARRALDETLRQRGGKEKESQKILRLFKEALKLFKCLNFQAFGGLPITQLPCLRIAVQQLLRVRARSKESVTRFASAVT